MSKPRIVILGVGFGGMYVAKKLARLAKRNLIDLTVVNRTNYFLFTPLLHEVATGGLNPRSVAEPLREVFVGKNVHIVQGDLVSINTESRMAKVRGAGTTETHDIPYDYAVVSTGAETNYYNITGAKENSLPLKTLSDAVRIRSRVINAFEQAVLVDDPAKRAQLLSFAIVGGGATGVEVTAELAEFVRGMTKRYYKNTHCDPGEAGHCRAEEVSVTLINATKELLEMFPPSLRAAAMKRLTDQDVTIRLNTAVTEVTPAGLKTADGSMINASTIIWSAGVKAIVPTFEKGQPALAGGRIIVDQYFRIQGGDRVFALGDAAGYVDPHAFAADSKNTRAVPMLAQVAVEQAVPVAYNLIAAIKNKPLHNFHYHSKGSMVSVGQWFALGEIYSMKIAGRLTWWIWRTVYLFKFASWQKRVRIAIDWTLDFFYPRDISKLT